MSEAIVANYNNNITKHITGDDTTEPYADWSAHDKCGHIPNAITLKAMAEAEKAIELSKAGARRDLTLDEMFKELGI